MDNVVIIKIQGIEYEFKLKSSSILYLEKKLGKNIFEAFQNPDFTIMENLFYHSVIHTQKQKITLFHTPIFFISKVKKRNPSIEAGISKRSKWLIGSVIALLVIAMPIIPLFT